ncbi:Acetylornithine deacetylase/Succinyl-diaminopimelate desuccinylase [Maribacter sedimenticola]|uniref:Acetylornithine deacetylase/Succinyl-diaminopimelate desuccinylase n=1 Tax=Maribacter sedimenticola TaxID=228956 RepID=A0ABY1SKP3_9FLAO|nr:M20/M25/M40 family metallo-hydrolase [Maribacter sedimenticola]SNR71457.1 Acetylornithine deacetylase/Succinyl-diaminopimelate desuccinylase [Maribacter sedimenticola]
MKKWVIICGMALSYFNVFYCNGQTLETDRIKSLTSQKFNVAITNLHHFLRLQNNGNFPEQIQKNLHWCDSVFTALNFETRIIKSPGAPLLFAEKKSTKNTKSILFYLQIDGQPVDPKEWSQSDPFEPTIKEFKNGEWNTLNFEKVHTFIKDDYRIFARSASDSKGPAMALITALQILKEQDINPEYDIKVIMDFQEELGSPDLPYAVNAHKELLQSDMLLIMDGTRHLSNLPTLTYGARGIATASIKVFGPNYALHSGQYGNYAPNPVFEAARLISSFKDENGRVLVKDFYKGVHLTEKEKKSLSSIPENNMSLNNRLGIATPEKVGSTYQEALQYPSLNIRGLRAGWTGKEVRTIIPEDVLIEIDMRLVPETPAERQLALLKSHILSQGYHLVDSLPTNEERAQFKKLASFNYRIGSKPFRTDIDSPIGTFLNKALTRVFGDQIINMRTTGGSQPIAPFITTLNIPAVSVRIPNPDNNIHGPNENLRIGNYKEGIWTCLAILTQPLP